MQDFDLFTCKIEGSYLEQTWSNVFTYQVQVTGVNPILDSPVNYDAIWPALTSHARFSISASTSVPANLLDCISLGAQIRKITYQFEFDQYGFFQQSFGPGAYPGLRAGTGGPPFITTTLVAPRQLAGMRNGRKAIGPLSESDYSQTSTAAAYNTQLQEAATAFSADAVISFTSGLGEQEFTLTPWIWKRIKVPVIGGGWVYRMPDSRGEYGEGPTGYRANWVAKGDVTTMNSRKLGRGD